MSGGILVRKGAKRKRPVTQADLDRKAAMWARLREYLDAMNEKGRRPAWGTGVVRSGES